MSDNLKLWDSVSRVPQDQLKSFKRAGGFSGTAIKPMWSIKTMTEHFGPCGEGWGVNEPTFSVHPANTEILVYCTVSIWHTKRENTVFGVGGDKILVSQSSGLRTDDEAFKKAYTDAITNALKLIGVGADIHMGLWDGNKYVDEPQEPSKPKLATVSGEAATPKAQSREPFDKISKGITQIEQTGNLEDLTLWYKKHVATIEKFEASWHEEIMDQFITAKDILKGKAA